MKPFRGSVIALVVILAACSPAGPPSTTPAQITAPGLPGSPTSEPPAPTRTPDKFPNPVLKVTGPEEIVFDWSRDQCEPENIPDLAARAYRDAGNQVHLVLSHYINYEMLGPDLNSVKADCHPVLESDYDAEPAQFDDAEWLAAPYTEDGTTVYALVHNEYRGHTHSGVCPSGDYFDCLDTSITLAVSEDGGRTYTEVGQPPEHLIATLPHQYLAGAGPFGLRNPSNIIKGKDGFFYAFSNVSQYQTEEQWVCLMRSDNLGDPRSWRFWNGRDFSGVFVNPYDEAASGSTSPECARLAWPDIGASLNESITYNTYLSRYVLIGNSADHLGGREVWGFYYSFSDDLLHWTHRKLLLEMPLPWTVSDPGRDASVLYPSLLDPDSAARNFDETGETAYVYFTRMNHGAGNLDRDLIRIPVAFMGSP